MIIALAGFLLFNIYSYKQNREYIDRYSLSYYTAGTFERADVAAFLTQENPDRSGRHIEIFDVCKGSVIKRIGLNSEIQGEAEKYLKSITGMYVRVKAIPDNGHIIKIPLEPPVKVQNKWLDEAVDELFVILPEETTPYLLVLDDKGRPLFYTFEGNVNVLLDNLNF